VAVVPTYRDVTRAPKKPKREATERALLAAILAHPAEDAPRAVYADWLTERGEPRGEFITLQLAKRQTPALRARADALLAKHKKDWVGRFGGKKVEYGFTERTWAKANPTKWEFVRGFVDWCSMKAEDFARNAPALLEAEPVRRAHVTDRDVESLIVVKEIRELRELDFRRVRLKGEIATLVGATCFAKLEVLGLEMCGLGIKGTKVLATAEPKNFPALFALELADNALGDAGVKLLAAAPILGQLRWLDLSRNQIGDVGARALAESPHLDRIEHLDVFGNPLGDGLARLRKRFGKRLVSSAEAARRPPHELR
jgi:uncharacterized protein (TIGR02996 family)